MRDYSRFDAFVTDLTEDIYGQPSDSGHTVWGTETIQGFLESLNHTKRPRQVLDVGCGQGIFAAVLGESGYRWTGVTIGEDYRICKQMGLNVHEEDMTFLPFADGTFSLVFARHVLEHSPFPIITLMEWRRVCDPGGNLILVAPSPDWWGYKGANHYSVAPLPLLRWWLERAGWKIEDEKYLTTADRSFLRAWKDGFKDVGEIPGDGSGPSMAMVEYRLLCSPNKEVRG